MRTLRTLVMAMVGMVGATAALHAQSSDFTLSADGDTLIKYNGPGGRIVIPNGVKVIGELAFGDVDHANTTLTEVVIPEGVTTIEWGAFVYCSALTSVNIPEGVTTIREFAFEGCSALTSVTIPNSVTTLGRGNGSKTDDVFAECTSLTEAIVGDNVPQMNYVFYNCPALQTLVIGTKMQTLETQPFADDYSPALETLVIRSLQPPTITTTLDLPSNLPAVRTLYIREDAEAYWNADTNGWKTWATDVVADIPVGHDTIWLDTAYVHDTITDITHKDSIIYDTILHKDSIHYDTIIHKDSIHYDTIYHRDSTVIDTIIHKDSIIYDNIYHRDSTVIDTIIHRDSIIYDDTLHRDTTIYRDTIIYRVSRRDTVIYTDTVTDTTHVDTTVTDTVHVNVYDTTRTAVEVVDTQLTIVEITDTALVPETLIVRDTLIELREVEVPFYVVIDFATEAQTIVSENARAVDGANGVMLDGLVAGALYAVYSTDGALVVRGAVPAAGQVLLRDLPPGTYLLWHNGKWSKFVHR